MPKLILTSRAPCYGEPHNFGSAPASFDVCELVATVGSCYNDGWTTANQLSATGSHGSDN